MSVTLPRAVTGLALTAALAGAAVPARAADLPVPCASGACGVSGPAAWVANPADATFVQSGSSLMTITQNAANVTLNWQSFNIGADGKVVFAQPSTSAVALNRIFQGSPSQIFGALEANGRVYLLNQNGIVFGPSAQVDVGGLVASSLDLTPDALAKGLARAIDNGQPAFTSFTDGAGKALPSGAVRVEAGASISAPGGQVLLIAPEITNNGTIATPDGQTILAAGQRVFLVASSDANVRGLLVEVGDGGTVTNGNGAVAADGELLGRILADRGNVTIAASTINQLGRVAATTSVRTNGSIRLQARDTKFTQQRSLSAERGGTLNLGAGSTTSVTLSGDAADTAVDASVQPKSQVLLAGGNVTLHSGATVTATGGTVSVVGSVNQLLSTNSYGLTNDTGSIVIEPGARIDVSGADVTLPMERNVLRVELRGNQLADSPLQRDGPLRSEAVYVDVRSSGTRADGSTWIGSPIGDLSGDVSTIKRDVFERNTVGGSISLSSPGSVTIANGAALDVSGGHIDWTGGFIKTTQVLGADGKVYDISQADRDRNYVGIVSAQTVDDLRWGTSSTYALSGADPRGRYEAGYVEGRDAGSVSVAAPRIDFAGSLVGNTVAGVYQRKPASTVGGVRPYDQVPLGAQLVLGFGGSITNPKNFVLGDVLVTHGAAPADGSVPALVLNPDLLGPNRVARLSIFSNGVIRVVPGAELVVPDGGEINLTGFGVEVAADLTAPGGLITLSAQNSAVHLADATHAVVGGGVTLDVSERWINDALDQAAGSSLRGAFVDGGRIVLNVSNGAATVGAGSVLDVSAGARLGLNGAVQAGKGGSLSIALSNLSDDALSELEFAGTLRGYALANGGTLAITTNGICVSAVACDPASGALIAPADVYGGQGFGSVSLTSTIGGLTVPDGATITARQLNYLLRPLAEQVASGATMSEVADVGLLPDYVRAPLNLSLVAANRTPRSDRYSDLTVGLGARIVADPLAQVSLRTNSRLVLLGEVIAPGGNVTVSLDAGLAAPFRPDQALWLGDHALIDVSGTVIRTPAADGSFAGRVLAGGSVTLAAQRGYLVTLPGSRVVASGTHGEVDIGDSLGFVTRRDVASAGGSITLVGAEGMLLNGALEAAAGGAGVLGGSLSLARAPAIAQDLVEYSPLNDSNLIVSRDAVPIVVDVLTPVPANLRHYAAIAAPTIQAGGFDSLSLAAANFYLTNIDGNPFLGGYGRVLAEPGVDLELRGRVTLATTTVGMTGVGEARLSGTYLALGTTERSQQDAAPATEGAGALTLGGELIDLIGRVTTYRLGSLRLDSSGDVRLRGVFSNVAKGYVGRLDTAGDLTVVAQQLYPATLTDYTLAAAGAGRTLTVAGAAGTPGAVLSAAGSVTLSAPSIAVSGRVVAPAGQITLVGGAAHLLAGGVLSTSTENALIPFGTTQGGLSWAYPVEDRITRLYGADGGALPAQRITVNAAVVDLAPGSRVDANGGGDLYAYEFVKGPNGSQDVLSGAVRPGQYAIVPGLDVSFAPYDPLESAGGSNLRVGDSVYLSAGSGVPAGTYTLLPARYALLPGAFLVTPVGGYTDLAPGMALAQRDGGVIVSGYRTFADTGLGDSRTSGFLVEPRAWALQEAQYTVTSANSFFGTGGPGAGTSRRPADAGTLALLAGTRLVLDGAVAAAAATGGLAGGAEIAAAQIEITADGADAQPGYVAVSARSLASLGLDSIVIGAQRSSTALNSTLTTIATDIRVDGGATLRAAEVILAAHGAITLADGATVSGAGTALSVPGTLTIDGSTALVRAASDAGVEIARTAGSGAGSVLLAAGATLAGLGSVALDVAGGARLDGTVVARDGALWLGAPQIGLGAAPSAYTGLALDPAALSALGASRLTLAARSSLDLFGEVDLEVDVLRLATPSLTGQAGTRATLRAASIELSGGPQTFAPSAGTASLVIDSGSLKLTGGTVALANFAEATLSSSAALSAADDAAILAGGNLTVQAPLVTAASGKILTLTAGGQLVLAGAPGSASVPAPVSSAGATLRLTGSGVAIDTTVVARGGAIEARATSGDLALLSGAQLSVAGFEVVFDSVPVDVRGGSIVLSADAGNLAIGAGATLEVGSPQQALAGRVALTASGGAVTIDGTLHAGTAGAGLGSLSIDAGQTDVATALRTAATGGFGGAFDLRLRGPGDIAIAPGVTLGARSVSLIADQGNVNLGGSIDASGAGGGRVRVIAGQTLEVSGLIDAHATGPAANDARVELLAGGALELASSARINVGGGALGADGTTGGTVLMRLPREAVLSALPGQGVSRFAVAPGSIVGARETIVEGVAVYTAPGGVIGDNETAASSDNPWFADSEAFAAGAAGIPAALGFGTGSLHVRPGIEVRADGDLVLGSDWNLADWRFGGEPGVLTLRAAGNLRLNRSLSDGFTSLDPDAGGFQLLDTAFASWSYRLVGGAAPGADPLSVAPADGRATGNVLVAPGFGFPGAGGATIEVIRTGTGSIEVAAANDIVLGSQASVIYTAGTARPGAGFPAISVLGANSDLPYPDRGGDLRLRAGRDVVAAGSDQLYTAWLLRGLPDTGETSARWIPYFQQFQQGIAAFGGGSVSVLAGRDVVNLGVSAPSIGTASGAVAGGTLNVAAGRDIRGGEFYVDGAAGSLVAGGRITAAPPLRGQTLPGALLAIGGGSLEVAAARGVSILTILNPTLQSPDNSLVFSNLYFATYTDDARVDITSAGGNVQFIADTQPGSALQRLKPGLNWSNSDSLAALRIAPPSLRVTAAAGNLNVGGAATLWPAPRGNLELFAQNNVVFDSVRGGAALNIIVSDAAVGSIAPTIDRPTFDPGTYALALSSVYAPSSVFNASQPVHGADERTGEDPVPTRVVALNGDVQMQPTQLGAPATLYSAKPTRVIAGRDIVNLGLRSQNLAAGDVTTVIAGRDFVYPFARSSIGSVLPSPQEVIVDGPGRLEIIAGRDVNLQSSRGLTSEGNIRNAALPNGGADILVAAGVGDRGGSVARMVTTYLAGGTTYDQALLDFVARQTGTRPVAKAEALAAFAALTLDQQYAFVEQLLTAELRAGGRYAAQPGAQNGDFRRAFAALEAFFPGANPAPGTANPYVGDINLYFSRIYTLDDGAIDLLAPGGEINVGLAAPPTAFGLAKTAADLGIVVRQAGSVSAVAYRDFQVNESRVFAADGGNILVWSTDADIDAGRGAKTAISAPPPVVTIGSDGQVQISFPPALTGSGIQTLATSVGRSPGDVDLFAPRGVVNAGDAGIVAGNLTIAATAVIGAGNISVSGTAVGVPVDVGGLGASLSGASSGASAATAAAQAGISEGPKDSGKAPLADSALNWLDVFVVGLGEDACRPDDLECLKRQKRD